MKPLGLTAQFQVIRPNRAQDAIYRAVEEAILQGMTVAQFKQEAWECWELVRQDEAKREAKEWSKS
jgi:hypothetical protein